MIPEKVSRFWLTLEKVLMTRTRDVVSFHYPDRIVWQIYLAPEELKKNLDIKVVQSEDSRVIYVELR